MEPRRCDAFFDKMAQQEIALELDDVTLRTGFSEVMPHEVDVTSRFSRNVTLRIPIVSAAMDTVTEFRMAIAMAQLGGISVIHRNLSPEEQGEQLRHVKRFLNGKMEKPITARFDEKISAIENRRREHDYQFHSFPVLDQDGRLVGLLTRNDFDLCEDPNAPASSVMTRELVTGKPETTLKEAYALLKEARKKILPLVDGDRRLVGMYVLSDVKRLLFNESTIMNTDTEGRLRVAAAVGTGDDALKRLECAPKDTDVFVIDTAHGDSRAVFETLKLLKRNTDRDIVVGNVSEGESALRLACAGADGIKVGQGPGSICTTRIVTGIGCPQLTAVYNCALPLRGSDIPVCADGGISESGQIPKALGAGAHSVMLGRIIAGCEETPGETIMDQGRRKKNYRGMGSLAAMRSRGGRERYGQGDVHETKLVPEGIEGEVPYAGHLKDTVHQLVGGLRAGMGYLGARSIADLHEKADFRRLTENGLRISHPHDIHITAEAPNYGRNI